MLAWMTYATLVGALFVAAAALLEHFSPWLTGRRRFVWLAVIAGALVFVAVATVSPFRPTERVRAANGTGAMPRTSPSTEPATRQIPAAGAPLVVTGRTPASEQPSPSSDSTFPSLDVLLIAGWFASSALCLAVLVVSAWRISRMRKGWRESVLAGVPVLVSHDVGPAVIGLVHHGIVVPSWVETLREDDQRTVMTHEREHVRAGDPLLLWTATLLVTLMPWNAALWYALRRLRHAIEIDCDARVLRSRPDTRAYCSLLLDVGERTLAGVAPIAALAEPATLLERRIDAMTAPVRATGRRLASSTIAAFALVAVACWAPRPEVAPRARVAALVSELSTLLATDSVRRTLSVAERADAMGVLASAPRDDESPSHQFGARVDSLSRVDYPEAFKPRDDAFVVIVVFDADRRIMNKVGRRLPLNVAFDVLPGAPPTILATRNVDYLLSRFFQSPLPARFSSGTQTGHWAPHAILAYVHLMPGEPMPRALLADTLPPAAAALPRMDYPEVNGEKADAIARRLYPQAYAPHDGIMVVGLILSPDGEVLTHASRYAEHDSVFLPRREGETASGEFARPGESLLALLFADLPAVGRSAVIAHRTNPGPALVWTVLPTGAPLPRAARETAAVRSVPVAIRTTSRSHQTAEVSLSSEAGGVVMIYSTGFNAVERGSHGMTIGTGPSRSIRADTMRIGLPASISVDLMPGGEVHFVSLDGAEFNLSATIAGAAVQKVDSRGRHVILQNAGSLVRSVK